MKIEVVAIGDEILSGFVLNENAAFISQELFKEGFQVDRQSVLSDEPKNLKSGLQEALERSQLVICTGGLGPTCDDRTREIAAEIFLKKLEYSEKLANFLRKKFENSSTNINIWLKDQATVIADSEVIQNPFGSASGFILSHNSRILILLPGVPAEMRAMLIEHVIPYLKRNFSSKRKHFGRWIHLDGLQESAVDPLLRSLKTRYPKLEFGIYPHLGFVSVFLKVNSFDEETAQEDLQAPLQEISTIFSAHVFESSQGNLESAVHDLLIQKKLTISIAESCTGGAVAARFTKFPGSSKYFIGSVVAYSNQMKEKILGVSEHTLHEKSAFSGEVAKEMLLGILSLTKSDYGLAVTGIAGPEGGSVNNPVGTVWGAIGRQGEAPNIWKIPTYGNRALIIERSVNGLLSALLQKIKN